MDFAKQFTEAAQKAVLLAVETGSWTRFPWIERMMKQTVSESLKQTITAAGPIADPGFIRSFVDPASPDCDKTMKATVSLNEQGSVAVNSVSEAGTDSFESNDFTHVDGYDYRIIVTDRMKDHRNSWAEHFKNKPTQEEFEYQFRHFHARTHHVHVNHWVDGDWETITGEYVPHWNKEKPKETLQPSEEWPEGKKFRIRFWDQRIDGFNYVYFDSKPGGIVLSKYHAAKCFAVTETRPEGV